MSAIIPVSFPDSTVADLEYLHDTELLSWSQIAALPEYTPIPRGTLCSIYNGYPIPEKWRETLGLPPIKKVKACPCGQVHVSTRCPNAPRSERRKQYRPRIHPTADEWTQIKALSADEKLRRLLLDD